MDATATATPPQPDYHCQPCGISMNSANTATHLAGKKHRARCAGLATIDVSGVLHISVSC